MASNKIKKLKTGIFIDGSNILWGALNLKSENRWFVDYKRLKQYLKKQYSPLFFNFYGCIDTRPSTPEFVAKAKRQASFYQKLEGLGYNVITKPLKYLPDGSTKGDMDVDITIDMKNSLNDIEGIVLFAGDSDYLKAVKDFHDSGKYIRIYSFKGLLSWELKSFSIKNPRCNYKEIDSLRSVLEYKERN